MKQAARRVAVEGLGWVLLVGGVAAIPLPGPGLLLMFAGLAVLSQQYEWAERRLDPIKYRAYKGAAESVATKTRIAITFLSALGLLACGYLWITAPPEPGWWPLPSWLWLPGGLVTGVTQVVSSFVAVGLLVWSYRRYHGRPEVLAELQDQIRQADQHLRRVS